MVLLKQAKVILRENRTTSYGDEYWKNHIHQEVEEDTDDFIEPFLVTEKPNFEIDKDQLKPTISNASEPVFDKHKLGITQILKSRFRVSFRSPADKRSAGSPTGWNYP
jgi:hypothetical protein